MTILQAIVLGLLQGLTEFLPVSSTAHLRVFPALFGWSDPGAAFTAVTQIGTMLAVILYFRADIARLTRGFLGSLRPFRPFATADAREAWWIVLATLPIIACGLLLKDFIETSFRSLWVVSFALIALALLLFLAERISSFRRTLESITLRDTQAFGWAQALALIPGASRSGTTLTAGMLLGFTREAAARFSFLLSIPAVALSGVYELYSIRHALTAGSAEMLAASTLTAGITGYLTIEFLLRFLRTHRSWVFIIYRIALGALLLYLLSQNILQP